MHKGAPEWSRALSHTQSYCGDPVATPGLQSLQDLIQDLAYTTSKF